METMAHSIEVRYMKIDKDLLATYRNLLSATKDTLAQTQYTQLLAQIEISPTKRLENSYRSLFNAIDKYNHGDMDKLVSHRFLFDVLTASPKKRERDFVKSAGSNNTQNHRYIVMRYATLVENSVAELSALDMDKKDNEFHRKWIAELRERLDTKDNK